MIMKHMSIIPVAAYRKNVCKFSNSELNKLDEIVLEKFQR